MAMQKCRIAPLLVPPTALLALLFFPRVAASMNASIPADLVGSERCFECHESEELGGAHNIHMRIESFEVEGNTVGCEACHGPGSVHVEEGKASAIGTFAVDDYDSNATCLECHRTRHVTQWQASVHAVEGVTCVGCHSIHQETHPEQTCVECHATEVAQFRLPSHHPLREGKMDCASCHDVHSATDGMLKTHQRGNDLCFTCHQAKEGPFIFEHAPVQEDCSICHTPHGSVADNLLTANEPMLCLQCHDFHFHAGYQSSDLALVEVGGFEHENPMGAQGFNIAYTTSCTQCHSRVHGSDTPSQTVTGAGRGLIQ
jgi:DmsE family decaheme c-type cytochrome